MEMLLNVILTTLFGLSDKLNESSFITTNKRMKNALFSTSKSYKLGFVTVSNKISRTVLLLQTISALNLFKFQARCIQTVSYFCNDERGFMSSTKLCILI